MDAIRNLGLAAGIYFGLDEDVYHRDPALGSGDMRSLRRSAPDFWWNSRMNSAREDDADDTPARIFGRAVHRLVLEGEKAFDKEYARVPDQDKDASASEKGQATKAAKALLARTKPFATMLAAKDYDRVVIAGAMITKHPALSRSFVDGIPEVSVFWERNGIMRKARIDYLKPAGVGDLKSITNLLNAPLPHACRSQIASYRYDIQAAHYLEARARMGALFAAGAVYGDHDREFLKRVVGTKRFAFQFVFFQKTKAPMAWSCVLSPGNPIIEYAGNDLEVAAERYGHFLDIFGRNSVWILDDTPGELEIESLPAWYGRD